MSKFIDQKKKMVFVENLNFTKDLLRIWSWRREGGGGAGGGGGEF